MSDNNKPLSIWHLLLFLAIGLVAGYFYGRHVEAQANPINKVENLFK